MIADTLQTKEKNIELIQKDFGWFYIAQILKIDFDADPDLQFEEFCVQNLFN